MSKKRNTIKRNIKLLSWSAFLGFITITLVSIYNTYVYLQNLKNVKVIVELIDSNTSANTKEEVIQALSSHVHTLAIILLLLALFGFIFSAVVFYLARKIKKETDQKIHAMDWIIE